jgi:hypothetical protein
MQVIFEQKSPYGSKAEVMCKILDFATRPAGFVSAQSSKWSAS